jgi:hypothetical protein
MEGKTGAADAGGNELGIGIDDLADLAGSFLGGGQKSGPDVTVDQANQQQQSLSFNPIISMGSGAVTPSYSTAATMSGSQDQAERYGAAAPGLSAGTSPLSAIEVPVSPAANGGLFGFDPLLVVGLAVVGVLGWYAFQGGK